jgi:hypothetical protein
MICSFIACYPPFDSHAELQKLNASPPLSMQKCDGLNWTASAPGLINLKLLALSKDSNLFDQVRFMLKRLSASYCSQIAGGRF